MQGMWCGAAQGGEVWWLGVWCGSVVPSRGMGLYGGM